MSSPERSTRRGSLPVIQPWYADGLSFTCTQCGNCCTGAPGYVWISDEELSRLAEHLKTSVEQVVTQYCRRVGGRVSLNEHRTPQGNYDCVFLREQRVPGESEPRRTCAVYPVRPLQCRTWPFWDANLSSEQSWRHAARRCPGIGKGRPFTLGQIEDLRTATDWPERPPSSK
jgi:hypothetical protein